jgi:hypothetical protein
MKVFLVTFLLASLVDLRGAVEESLKTLSAVQREGAGNEAAGAAWKEVVKAGPAALPQVLASAGKGSAVADNWLRLAGDAIVDKAVREKHALPVAELEAFLKDTSKAAPGRRLAFDLLMKADRAKAEEIELSLANDPVQELRRGAVQRMLEGAKKKTGAEAKDAFLKVLEVVRDEDQAKIVAGTLKKMGVTLDLPKHFGFLTKWQVIGPFENAERKGFDAVYPPEKEIKLDAAYDGKGKQVKWQAFESKDDYGKLDFNKPLGMLKESTAYAMATFEAPAARDAELRIGCKNAWKVWLNGELVFGRDEYHRGQEMDQYKLKCRLKQGTNTVLVKCCQNEQKEEWTVEWEFQLRVCDGGGTAILAGDVRAKP